MKNKNNAQNSGMDILFKFYSPLNKSTETMKSNTEIKNIKNSGIKTSLSFKFNNIINYNELEYQSFNLNGNYKKIYFYKDDIDDLDSFNISNNSLDINNFTFKEFNDEKSIKEEKKSEENNIKSINNISNKIKKNILSKENKKINNDIKKKKILNKTEKKTNKINNTKNLNKNNIDKINNDLFNKKGEIENNNINISYKIINESKNNNNSKVIFSKMNNNIMNNNNNENINKITNLKLMNNQQKNIKDNNSIENKTKSKKKINKSQSMDKLNSIIEDYYKSKNINNTVIKITHIKEQDNVNNSTIIINNQIKEEDNVNNNSTINNTTGLVKVTYSSSCDNKKIRTISSFRGPKVTVFQHFHKKHTVNNNYRDS